MNEGNNVNGVYRVNNNVNGNNGGVERLIGYNTQDAIADKLCKELNNPQYRAFYCKVAYKLSEAQIWNTLEQAKKGRSPAKYFSWLVSKQMRSI